MAKSPKEPEQYTFKLLGMEVTGIGWLPSRCAMVLSYIAVLLIAAYIIGAAIGWWSGAINLPNLSGIRDVVQG